MAVQPAWFLSALVGNPKYRFSHDLAQIMMLFQFSGGYQPTVGVDYGFKIQNVKGLECKSE